MHYQTSKVITDNQWNNSFSYQERITIIGKAEITIPSYKKVSSVSDITLWIDTVFEEIDHTWTLKQCTWLSHIYELTWKQNPVYIFDNHNHALHFWWKYTLETNTTLPVIHIDQHSDLAHPEVKFDLPQKNNLDYLRDYTNHSCNVGNFIHPALQAWYISECLQVRSEQALLALQIPSTDFILDIDLDFWAPEMSISEKNKTIEKTKELIHQASLLTIATSPYFLEQEVALKLLQELYE